VFRTDLSASGKVGSTILEPGTWHDITLSWNLGDSHCQLLVDGANAATLNVRNTTLNGVSYVRFRSSAKEIDTAGFLVDSVKVRIDNPYAPPCSAQDQIEQEERYIKGIVPQWRENL